MPRTRARFQSKFLGCSARERNDLQNVQDAPHGSAIFFKIFRMPHFSAIFFQIFRMLRTGARFCPEFSRCSARERDVLQNLQDAPHRSAIFKILRTGARFVSKFSGCSARERDFERRRRESYTEAKPECSAQDRPLEPRTKYTGTRLT